MKTKQDEFKANWMVMTGNEVYFYRKQEDEVHKFMHCLSGTYLKSISEEMMAEGVDIVSGHQYFPCKIVIPPNKSRMIYFASQQESDTWTERFQASMSYTNVFDFYELEKTLGKGQFGLVKLGSHIKSNMKVAVKQVKKKNMTHIEVFQQRREIEVLKMC